MRDHGVTPLRTKAAGVTGAAVVLAGQLLLRDGRWIAGLVISAVGAAEFGVAAYKLAAALGDAGSPPSPTDNAFSTRRWTRRSLPVFAIAGALLGVLVAVVNPDHLTAQVWLLQGAGITVLVLAGLVADGGVQTAQPLPRSRYEISPRVARTVLACIVVLGTWIRFRHLGTLPAGFWFDEADVALIARRIVDDSTFRPVFSGVMPGYHGYLIAGLFSIFGESVTAVRAVTAAFGVGTIFAGYMVGRELFGRTGGLLLAALIAFSRWSITLSRIAMHNVTVPFFALMTLGLLLRAMRRRSTLDFVLAGLFAGAGLMFYSAMAASIVALGLFVVTLTMRSGTDLRWALPRLAAGLLAVLMLVSPLAKFAATEPDIYFARNRVTAIWDPASNVPDGELRAALVDNVVAYIGMGHYRGDSNGRHNLPVEPMLPPLVAAFSILGLVVAVLRLRPRIAALVAIWLPIALLPGILSLPWEAPNTLRAVAAQPVFLILATAGLVVTADLVGAATRDPKPSVNARRAGRIVGAVALAGFSMALVADVEMYFGAQADAFVVWSGHSTRETLAGELIASAPSDTTVLAVAYLNGQRTVEFLAGDRPVDAYFTSETPLPLLVPPGHDALILAFNESLDLEASGVLAKYPNATVEKLPVDNNRPPVLTVIRIPRADLEASWGWTRSENQLVGTLIVDQTGSYQFRADAGSVTIAVDGAVAQQCGRDPEAIGLTAGLHQIVVAGWPDLRGPELDWLTPDTTAWTPVPAWSILEAEYMVGGLVATFFTDPDDRRATTLRRIDPALDLGFHEAVIPQPLLIEWTGSLDVAPAGQYELTIASDDESSVYLGGVELLKLPADGGEASVAVDLNAGPQSLVVSYLNRDGVSFENMHLWWTPPGGNREIVPASALTPEVGGRSVNHAYPAPGCP